MSLRANGLDEVGSMWLLDVRSSDGLYQNVVFKVKNRFHLGCDGSAGTASEPSENA